MAIDQENALAAIRVTAFARLGDPTSAHRARKNTPASTIVLTTPTSAKLIALSSTARSCQAAARRSTRRFANGADCGAAVIGAPLSTFATARRDRRGGRLRDISGGLRYKKA